MIRKYTLETNLDLGDLGLRPAHIEGSVEMSGPANAFGTKNIRVTLVQVEIKGHPALIDVTAIIGRAAKVDIEERLEAEFERELLMNEVGA